MCQYDSKCPTIQHYPGALCPVEEQRRKRERQVLFGLLALSVCVAVAGLWWTFFR